MKIAFIGLGAMGLPMATRLAADLRHSLTVFDASPDRLAESAHLGRAATSVADAVAAADVAITVLPADPHVRAVAEQLAAAGRPGLLYLDFSTIAPQTIEQAAADLAKGGVRTVSAALTRGTAAARSGRLSLFVSCDGPLPDGLDEVFEAMAEQVQLLDGLGAAKTVKIVNNMVLGCVNCAIGEVLVLGSALGIDPQAVTSALADGGAGSWALTNQTVRHVLRDDLGPGYFGIRYMAKDMRLFTRLAHDVGAPAPLAAVAAAFYRGTTALGLGEAYHPVVVRWLEHAAGLDGRRPAGDAPPGALDALVGAVAAAQRLVSVEGLAVARAAGVPPAVAARLLAEGSAANDQLAEATDLLAADVLVARPDSTSPLRAAIELADGADVPALLLSVAAELAAVHP